MNNEIDTQSGQHNEVHCQEVSDNEWRRAGKLSNYNARLQRKKRNRIGPH